MAVTSDIRTERRRGQSGLGEAIVLASMATVAAVIGAVLVLQIGTPLWVAFAVAAMFLVAVLAAHVLVRRSEQLSDLKADMAQLDDRLGRAMVARPNLDMPPARKHAMPPASGSVGASGTAGGAQSASHAKPQSPGLTLPPAANVPAVQRTALGIDPELEASHTETERRRLGSGEMTAPALSGPISPGPKLAGAPTERRSVAEMSGNVGAMGAPSVGERVAPALVPLMAARAGAGPSAGDGGIVNTDRAQKRAATPASTMPANGSDTTTSTSVGDAGNFSIDALLAETTPRPPIDDLLKRLAGDISAGVIPTNGLSAGAATANAPEASVRYAPNADGRPVEPEPLLPWSASDNSRDGARDAIYQDGATETPGLMHETVARVDTMVSEPTEAIAIEGKMAAIVDALSNERLELVLEPIIGFESLTPEHFDVTVRLRQAGGQTLEIEGEDEDAARGMGLLALLDTVKIVRTKNLIMQSMADGSELVLSALDAHTLQNDQFHEDIADLAKTDRAMTGRLVLTFRQSDVRTFAPVEWQALARLSAIGFHFGIDLITDLDMDFGELSAGGFVFARLDADVFLEGMMVAGGTHVSPGDVCRHLTESGLGLVVRRIDDSKRLARVMGFGVTMGQGAMFAAGARAVGLGKPAPIGKLRIDS